MKWYRSLPRNKKVHVRECFELACGITLKEATMFLSFRECMDVLYDKLKLVGFQI